MDTRTSGAPITGEASGLDTGVPEKKASQSGLKAINRRQGDSRLAKIVPTADNELTHKYYSRYSRDFVMRDYNFCASKMAVARNNKTVGIDLGFKLAEEWYEKANAWANNLDIAPFPLFPETITLPVPHPNAGRLLRILGEYDRFFVTLAGAALAGTVTAEGHENALKNAQARINYIHYLCRFDADHFEIDGTLLTKQQSTV
ncbi:MAG: DUF1845 domain-containing protein [Pseudomonadota bacterium]